MAWLTETVAQPASCDPSAAEFITVQGSADLRRAGTPDWLPALVGHQICYGDSVRTSLEGQALVRLADGTLLNLNSGTQSTFGEAPESGGGTLVELIRGIIHVISRDPRSLRFDTPYVNAGLEGTEFTIAVTDAGTEVTVVEGEVSLANALGSVRAPQGTRGLASAASPPTVSAVATATTTLSWTAYFPEIVSEQARAATNASAVENDSAALALRAAARLRIGLPDSARSDLARSIALDGSNATAWSLRALIAVAENDEQEARSHVTEALAHDAGSTAAHLALSYVEQRFGTLADALAAALNTTAADASAALVWERRAELLAATGDAAAARRAAAQAIALDGGRTRAHAVLGFVELAERRNDRAAESFLTAVARDPALPLARLGLALAYTQMGRIEAGREQLEIAVSLDARDSQIRSYMAKSYATEHREELGSTLLQIAKQLNAADPTPWLYSAKILQDENKSVAALWEYEQARDRSVQQPVFRSTFTLDDDTAVRSSGLGNLYRSLRFDRLASLAGFDAVEAQPADYAGHQLLADVDSLQPRLQMARVNEHFKAQLLRPVNVVPTHPHFGEANLFLVDVFGPSELATSDLIAPMAQDGPRVHVSATTGSNATRGTEILVTNTHNRLAVSAGAHDFETDGFDPNNDFSQRVANALFQFQLSADTSLLFEGRTLDIDRGSITRYFHPNSFQAAERADLNVDTLRAGFRRKLSPRDTLIGFVSSFEGNESAAAPGFSAFSTMHGRAAELQHLHAGAAWSATTGFSVSDRHSNDRVTTSFPGPPAPIVFTLEERSEVERFAIYGYASVDIGNSVQIIAGIEAARFDDLNGKGDALYPKLGLEWQLAPRTRLRASSLENRQGPILSPLVVEPTLAPNYVAGFNQRYFATGGEEFRQTGLALDHTHSERIFFGAEVLERDVARPFVDLRVAPPQRVESDVDETMNRAYLYWTATQHVAVAAELQQERFDNVGIGYFDNYDRISTRRLPLTVSVFHRPRFSTQLRGTFVDQSGEFLQPGPSPDSVFVTDEDAFWVLDLAATYRLPRRHGTLTLVAANVLDERFSYQDTDPRNPRIFPERMLSLRFTVAL